MPNENNLLQERAQLAAVLDNPDAIQRIKEPTEKVQIAAVQKKPELVRLFTNPTDRKSTRLNSSHKVQSRMPSSA